MAGALLWVGHGLRAYPVLIANLFVPGAAAWTSFRVARQSGRLA